MWNYNEKYTRFTAGNTPASGTNNVTVEGIYLFPIVVRVPAPSSVAIYGTYEFAITDKTIKSQAEAVARALAELTSYQNMDDKGTIRNYLPVGPDTVTASDSIATPAASSPPYNWSNEAMITDVSLSVKAVFFCPIMLRTRGSIQKVTALVTVLSVKVRRSLTDILSYLSQKGFSHNCFKAIWHNAECSVKALPTVASY